MKTKLFALVTILILSLSVSVKAQTWEYVNTLQNEWLQKVCTQGLDTVYIVGQNGLIAKSTNRALTWNKQYISSKTTLNDVIFINHTIGFAVGANGTIIKTTDAGTNWTLQTNETWRQGTKSKKKQTLKAKRRCKRPRLTIKRI